MAESDNDIAGAYTLVFDGLDHLGPGDSTITRTIAERLDLKLPSGSRIADFGCGVGASALVLAQSLPNARVLAVDAHAPFIERLKTAASAVGIEGRVSAEVGNMADPPPLDGVRGDFDLIWSESAIYAIGRVNAFEHWRPLLKPGGWLVFSDIAWQIESSVRSGEVSAFWETEYPDIATPDAILDQLSMAGYAPLEPISTGLAAWFNYYEPLRDRLRFLAERQNLPPVVTDLAAELRREIEIYDRAGDEVALCFFMAQRDSSSG